MPTILYLLNAYDIPGTLLSAKDLAVNEKEISALKMLQSKKCRYAYFHILKTSKLCITRTFTFIQDELTTKSDLSVLNNQKTE